MAPILVVAASAAPLHAQQGTPQPAAVRRPLFGSVESPDGPLPGAQVLLIGVPPGYDPDRGATDAVEVTADERGRFRADVLGGVPYCGMAAGAGRRSEVVGWFGCGALVRLACDREAPATAVQVDGLEPWTEHAIRLRRHGAFGFGLPTFDALPFAPGDGGGDGGRGDLPAFAPMHVELLDGTGEPLWLGPLVDTGSARRVTLPPPRELDFDAVDDAGAPLPGAVIRQVVAVFRDQGPDGIATIRRARHRALGATGADGTATFAVACGVDPFVERAHLMFTAVAPGRAETGSGFRGADRICGDRSSPDESRQVRFPLAAVEPIRGRVLHTRGAVPAGTRVRLSIVAKVRVNRSAYMHEPREYEAEVGPDGDYAIEHVPADLHACRFAIVLPDGRSVALPPQRARAVATMDLAAIATLRLRVLDVQRGPAAGRAVYVLPVEGRTLALENSMQRLCTDAAGAAEVAVWPGAWHVFVPGEQGHAFATVVLGAGDREDHEIAMQSFALVRGTLAGDRGEPIAGASLFVARADPARTENAEQQVLFQFLRPFVQRLQLRVRTAGDGSFAIPMLPPEAGLTTVRFAAEGRRTEDFVLEPRAEPLPLRLQ